MQCPDIAYLTLFARDPDAALDDLPAFEEHLSECESCRHAIEGIADDLHGEKPLEMVLGSDDAETNSELPHVPGYRLVEAIRSGGSGIVYRGVHLASGRSVAVKLIQSVVPSHWKRIVLERESLVQCDHPNIVTLLDYGQIPGGCYFVTRWMEQSLSESIAQNPIVDLGQAVDWMIQIAEAVQYVHGLGIVHRDLKPSNVLLNATGRPKLTDFGIAKQVLLDEGLTTTAAPIGTPGYMAPEQSGRIETPVSFATDVYGLGAVLYSLLTGRPPFLGGNPVQVLDQVVTATPISPRKLRADVPLDLERICLKCLEKSPTDRYASSADLIADLKRYSNGVPVRARPVWTLVRWARLARRQPVVTGLVALVGLVLMVAGFGFTSLRWQSQQQQRESEVRSVLQSIATTSPDRLDSLLDRLSEMDRQTVTQQIALLQTEHSGDDLLRLRWTCGIATTDLALNCDQLQHAIELANVQELPMLITRLRTHPVYATPAFIELLRSSFDATEADDNRLPMTSLLASIDSTWSPKSTSLPRILHQLALTPPVDSPFWARALKPISSALLEALKRAPTAMGKSVYWDSISVQNMAWQWSRNDASRVVQYAKDAPFVALKSLAGLPEETRGESLRLLNQEFRALHPGRHDGKSSLTLEPKLASFVDNFGGLVTDLGGYLKRVPQDQLSMVADALLSLGWCPSQLHPCEQDEEDLYSVTFERSGEPCKVEFAVPVSELPSRMELQRLEGYEATSVCTRPTDLDCLTVLWRKGEWGPSRFTTSETEAADIRKRLSEIDTTESETQLVIHFYDTDLAGGNDACFGLLTGRKLESESRRFVDLRVPRNLGDLGSFTQLFLESATDGNQYGCLSEPITRHDELAATLKSEGGTPVYFEMDTEMSLCHSKWRLDGVIKNQFNLDTLPKLAVAAWILGDTACAIELMDEARYPTLRTQIVEWLGRLDSSAPHFLEAFQQASTSIQRYGLLVALANWRQDQFQLHSNEFLSLFRELWNDNDPGVHFAADHLMRIAFPKQANTLVDVNLSKTHGLSEKNEDRRWFYGPFGLPFVIVDPSDFEILASDDRLPWILSQGNALTSLDHRLAVCAIETPEWLMDEYQKEIQQLGAEPGEHAGGSRRGPARGYRIDSMLHFCRWLNQHEGLDLSLVHFPNYPNLEPGPELPEDYLTRDGYRLPRNDEWEIVCRAGSWTCHFLGDSLDFINEYAWTSENTLAEAGDEGTKKPSPNGMFDILGNVYETVLGDPKEKNHGHVKGSGVWRFKDVEFVHLRGGAFLSHRMYCSSGAVNGITVGTDINAGFRIVRTLYRKTSDGK